MDREYHFVYIVLPAGSFRLRVRLTGIAPGTPLGVAPNYA
ncbi:hypothetical protein HDF09_003714 [Edaphobacter lichenicola]|uniref:Uncharacterized protein n=1 Tax=Tunturiibacter empetritectus TaxID=3069691 RepID=A0A7W8MTM2_9BACT|nr:hypothetical protein [Edaphobacter lichenicola]